MIPDWWQFALLALASFRAWRLLADDDILNRPRQWFLRLGRDWKPGDPATEEYREQWGLFLVCPWCAGAWVSGLIYLAWLWTQGEPDYNPAAILTGVGVWFALSASVGLIRGNLDEPDE